MIIAIAGRTIDDKGQVCSMGSGKSTVANTLIKKFGFSQIGLADPMRRFCQEVYQFSDDQVWGPSECRNALDTRYPRKFHDFDDSGKCRCCGSKDSEPEDSIWDYSDFRFSRCYLTARYALQTLGTEWSRNCDPLTWPRKLMQTALQLQEGDKYYDPKRGIQHLYDIPGVIEPRPNVVVCDVRFRNELEYIQSNGGLTLLVERRVKDLGNTLNSSHPSEVDLNEVPSSQFSALILNHKDLKELERATEEAYLALGNEL